MVPFTNESERRLNKLLNSALDTWELHEAADNHSVKADRQVEAALCLFMQKLHSSLGLQPIVTPPPPCITDDDCKQNQEVCAPPASQSLTILRA